MPGLSAFGGTVARHVAFAGAFPRWRRSATCALYFKTSDLSWHGLQIRASKGFIFMQPLI